MAELTDIIRDTLVANGASSPAGFETLVKRLHTAVVTWILFDFSAETEVRA